MSYNGHQFVGHFKARGKVLDDFDHMIPWESTQIDCEDISKTYHQPKSKWESFALATGCTDQMKCQHIYLNKYLYLYYYIW